MVERTMEDDFCKELPSKSELCHYKRVFADL